MTGPLIGASFLGGVGGAIAMAETRFPRPWSSGDQVRTYFRGSRRAARFSAAGQAISAVALARFTRTVARVASGHGPAARGAAIAGGALAAASLATSAVIATTLTARDVDDDTALRLSHTAFVAGGPVHGVGFGVLTAAVALSGASARPPLPRWLVATGLASAVCGVSSPLYFLWTPAGWLIPAGRFPGLVVAAVAGPLLSALSTHEPRSSR